MKKFIIFIVITLSCVVSTSANASVVIDNLPTFASNVKSSKASQADVAICNIVHPVDGKTYAVYKGSRGGLYIKRGASGKEYLSTTLRKDPALLAKIKSFAASK